jgi:uncharacterized membrane protein
MFPQLGCLIIAGVFFLILMMPLLLVDVMRTALERLHLSPTMAFWAVLGIFFGGLVNLPLFRLRRDEEQIVEPLAAYGLQGFTHRFRRFRPETIVAINLGGGVIPLLIALKQVLFIQNIGGPVMAAMLAVSALNIAVCYRVTRAIPGVGLAMPAFASPLVCVVGTWILLAGPEYASVRAPVAFVAGVMGPVIGTDLLHFRDIYRVSAGMLSIGGAGTFDGIVLSSILAALFA